MTSLCCDQPSLSCRLCTSTTVYAHACYPCPAVAIGTASAATLSDGCCESRAAANACSTSRAAVALALCLRPRATCEATIREESLPVKPESRQAQVKSSSSQVKLKLKSSSSQVKP